MLSKDSDGVRATVQLGSVMTANGARRDGLANRCRRALARLVGSAPSRPMAYSPPIGRRGRARIAVLTVTEEEFVEAQAVFQATENIPGTSYFVESLGHGQDWDIVLLQATDRSNVPMTECVGDVIDELRPQVLVLVGTAGGLCTDTGKGREGIDLGHVLIAEYVSYVEFVKITDQGVFLRQYAIDHPSLPFKKHVALPLQKTFRLAAALQQSPPRDTGIKIHIGTIVSGEKVFGGVNDPMQQKLLGHFDKALAVDMESIGMARMVCARRSSFWYHPRYVIIRGVSDLVGPPENNATRTLWTRFAAHAAAVVAREFIRRLPADRHVA